MALNKSAAWRQQHQSDREADHWRNETALRSEVAPVSADMDRGHSLLCPSEWNLQPVDGGSFPAAQPGWIPLRERKMSVR